MKKLFILIPLLFLVGCTNELEVEKYDYLTYKNELQEKEEFKSEEELDFNTYFDIIRENDEKIVYSIVIDSPKIDMYNVKALLIHDYMSEDVFPSVGIFDEPVSLLSDSDNKIILKGDIYSEKELTDTKFKLYLEYEDNEGLSNKIFYEVARG